MLFDLGVAAACFLTRIRARFRFDGGFRSAGAGARAAAAGKRRRHRRWLPRSCAILRARSIAPRQQPWCVGMTRAHARGCLVGRGGKGRGGGAMRRAARAPLAARSAGRPRFAPVPFFFFFAFAHVVGFAAAARARGWGWGGAAGGASHERRARGGEERARGVQNDAQCARVRRGARRGGRGGRRVEGCHARFARERARAEKKKWWRIRVHSWGGRGAHGRVSCEEGASADAASPRAAVPPSAPPSHSRSRSTRSRTSSSRPAGRTPAVRGSAPGARARRGLRSGPRAALLLAHERTSAARGRSGRPARCAACIAARGVRPAAPRAAGAVLRMLRGPAGRGGGAGARARALRGIDALSCAGADLLAPLAFFPLPPQRSRSRRPRAPPSSRCAAASTCTPSW